MIKIDKIILTILLIATLVLGYLYIHYTWHDSVNETNKQLLTSVKNSEIMIDKEAIKHLNVNQNDLENPNYNSVKNKLIEYVQNNGDVKFAYIYTLRNDKLYFAVDSEPSSSQDYSPPGQEYIEATDLCFQPFRDGKKLITPPETDRWGTWVSILIPIKDPKTGEIIAVFGVDYPAENWNDKIIHEIIEVSISTFAIIVLIIMIYIIFNKNITLKRKQQKLIEANSEILKWENIFKNSQWGIMTVNAETQKIELANAAYAKMHNYTIEEIVGKSILDIFASENPVSLSDCVEEVNRTGHSIFEFLHKRKDGTIFPALVDATAVKDESGKILYYTSNVQDITEKNQIERQLIESKERAEAANILKRQFVANMSHEIRTPVNGISGFLQLLQITNLDLEQKEYVNGMKASSKELLILIEDILDFSQIESGKLVLKNAPFDIVSVIEGVFSSFLPKAEEKGIEMDIEIDRNMPKEVFGDSKYLTQILNNLVSNAVKFTNQGKVSINVNHIRDDEYGTFRIAIKDTGIGISDCNVQRIFKPFIQVDGSMTRNYGGTGLGLAISKELIEMMNGDICVESVEKQGSIFSFDIRLKIAET